MTTFHSEVIEASHQKPVVVDFWAPWCAPCRVLGPVIEKLAEEQESMWTLVKLNTEEDPETASTFNIRSIPNVKMFYKGEVVAEFAGALPRTQIEKWLLEHLPSDQKENWQALQSELSHLDSETAIARIENFLADYPDHRAGRLALVQRIVFHEPAKAVALIAPIKEGEEGHSIAVDVHAYSELISLEDETMDPATKYLVDAQKELQKGHFDQGVEYLIEAVKLNKDIHRELPRRASIAVFRLLGSSHPTTKKYRRLFDMALY